MLWGACQQQLLGRGLSEAQLAEAETHLVKCSLKSAAYGWLWEWDRGQLTFVAEEDQPS